MRIPHFLSFEVVLTSEVYYMTFYLLQYIKKPTYLISDFRKKNHFLAGVQTHENETRHEEIYEDQSLSVSISVSINYYTLVLATLRYT